jgi:RNA polymerase sigma factor (sigma-70 family)
MYYFDDMTLSQIGKQYNVSREAVRQNIKRAIQIIQNHDKSANKLISNSL